MNLSYIVGFVICSTGTTSTAMMMILLLLILMKGIPLDMIQIEAILQTAPQLLQKPLKSSKVHLCILRLLFRTVPVPAELADKATIHCTVQKHYAEVLFQKSKGTKHCS